MTDKPTRTYCDACGDEPHGLSEYCPSCGAEDPWVEEPKYDFEDVDLPLVFGMEHYNDTYGLWKNFTAEAFGVYDVDSGDIANLGVDPRDMKYATTMVYYKVDENCNVHGPFLEKSEAREA